MKRLLIILTLLMLNTALALADIYVTVDGVPILMKPIETGDDTFLSKQILEDNTIEELQDKEITYRSANYDIRDSIVIKLEEDPDKGRKLSIWYYYVFDETIDMTKASFDGPLEIELLGKPYKITGVNSGMSFTFCNDCDSYSLNVGDSAEVGGKKVTLYNVGEGSVIVDVDGIQETVSKDNVATVGGIEILPIQTNYNYGGVKAQRSATLIIGEDIFRDVTAGGTFNGDSDWKWDIKGLNEKSATTLTLDKLSGPYIGIKNNPEWGNIDSEECITLPNNYPTICVKSCEEDCMECETESDCIIKGACSPIIDTYVMTSCLCENAKCRHISYCESNSDCVQVQNDMCGCKSIFINKDYYERWGTSLGYKLQTKSCSSSCQFVKSASICKDNMCVLAVSGGTPDKDINVYNFLNSIVERGENYVIVLGDEAPSSDSLATTDIASGIQRYSGGETVLEAKLASEVANEDKMILLGHPCDNSLINLSCKNWPYKQGETLIKVDDNNLIIAGTTSEDTRATAKIIANYKNYPFLKESSIILVTESGLEIPEIAAEPRQENEETEEEIVEENVSEKAQEKTSEITQEELEKSIKEPVEKKKGKYIPFTKRIWEWIISWFR